MKILRSMTGFGRNQQSFDSCTVVWEIRSVNGRFLDIKWRLPAAVRSLEASFEKIVRSHASRGRIEICLTTQNISQNGGQNAGLTLDREQAGAMLDALMQLAQSRGDTWTPDYSLLMSVPAVWTAESLDDEVHSKVLTESLETALMDWDHSREVEAKALASDLQGRFRQMAVWLKKIEERAPQIKKDRFASVRERLQEMLQTLHADLDENRFLQEITIMSDKLDVSEEITRLHSHLVRLDTLLAAEDAGRKLDFTLQECFREINTCGNKIQDAEVSSLVVDYKNELEKCREQVQNLE